MLKLSLGYPDAATEKRLMYRSRDGQLADKIQPVTHMDTISAIQREIREVFIGDPVADYLLNITRSTREHPSVMLGASPRATLSFMNAVKAYAFLHERDYVLPDDVKTLAPYVLSHRIICVRKPGSTMRVPNRSSSLYCVRSKCLFRWGDRHAPRGFVIFEWHATV